MKYIRTVSPSAARGLVSEVYRQAKREFGVVGEPILIHSPLPTLLAAVWSSLREAVLAGRAPRTIKEAAAVAVSLSNNCPYCVDAHTVMLRATKSHEAADAIQYGRGPLLRDAKLRAIAAWAEATVPRDAANRPDRPFADSDGPEIIGTVTWIHYINRIVTVFIGKPLILLPGNLPGLRRLSERLGGAVLGRAARRRLDPGTSLALVDSAAGGWEPEWSKGAREVAAAFAAWNRAATVAGSSALSEQTRVWAEAEIGRWDGSPTPLGRKWVEEPLAGLAERWRSEGRLALLSAIAPHQVDSEIVRDYRHTRGADVELLGAVAWGACAAAKRISSWL